VLDESTAALEVLERAVWAVGSRGSVAVLRVVPAPFAYPAGMERPPAETRRDEARSALEASRISIASRALAELGIRVHEFERHGARPAAVLEAARALEPDLLVVGETDSSVLDVLLPHSANITPFGSPWDVLVVRRLVAASPGRKRSSTGVLAREGSR
jgi:nucleotide-binding universal stress UspA family protein